MDESLHMISSVVMIHGLDGHWKSSWTSENGVYWPQDLLPATVPQARVLSYGYDARTSGSTPLSEQYLHDHAYELIGSLAMKREMTDVSCALLNFIDTLS